MATGKKSTKKFLVEWLSDYVVLVSTKERPSENFKNNAPWDLRLLTEEVKFDITGLSFGEHILVILPLKAIPSLKRLVEGLKLETRISNIGMVSTIVVSDDEKNVVAIRSLEIWGLSTRRLPREECYYSWNNPYQQKGHAKVGDVVSFYRASFFSDMLDASAQVGMAMTVKKHVETNSEDWKGEHKIPHTYRLWVVNRRSGTNEITALFAKNVMLEGLLPFHPDCIPVANTHRHCPIYLKDLTIEHTEAFREFVKKPLSKEALKLGTSEMEVNLDPQFAEPQRGQDDKKGRDDSPSTNENESRGIIMSVIDAIGKYMAPGGADEEEETSVDEGHKRSGEGSFSSQQKIIPLHQPLVYTKEEEEEVDEEEVYVLGSDSAPEDEVSYDEVYVMESDLESEYGESEEYMDEDDLLSGARLDKEEGEGGDEDVFSTKGKCRMALKSANVIPEAAPRALPEEDATSDGDESNLDDDPESMTESIDEVSDESDYEDDEGDDDAIMSGSELLIQRWAVHPLPTTSEAKSERDLLATYLADASETLPSYATTSTQYANRVHAICEARALLDYEDLRYTNDQILVEALQRGIDAANAQFHFVRSEKKIKKTKPRRLKKRSSSKKRKRSSTAGGSKKLKRNKSKSSVSKTTDDGLKKKKEKKTPRSRSASKTRKTKGTKPVTKPAAGKSPRTSRSRSRSRSKTQKGDKSSSETSTNKSSLSKSKSKSMSRSKSRSREKPDTKSKTKTTSTQPRSRSRSKSRDGSKQTKTTTPVAKPSEKPKPKPKPSKSRSRSSSRTRSRTPTTDAAKTTRSPSKKRRSSSRGSSRKASKESGSSKSTPSALPPSEEKDTSKKEEEKKKTAKVDKRSRSLSKSRSRSRSRTRNANQGSSKSADGTEKNNNNNNKKEKKNVPSPSRSPSPSAQSRRSRSRSRTRPRDSSERRSRSRSREERRGLGEIRERTRSLREEAKATRQAARDERDYERQLQRREIQEAQLIAQQEGRRRRLQRELAQVEEQRAQSSQLDPDIQRQLQQQDLDYRRQLKDLELQHERQLRSIRRDEVDETSPLSSRPRSRDTNTDSDPPASVQGKLLIGEDVDEVEMMNQTTDDGGASFDDQREGEEEEEEEALDMTDDGNVIGDMETEQASEADEGDVVSDDWDDGVSDVQDTDDVLSFEDEDEESPSLSPPPLPTVPPPPLPEEEEEEVEEEDSLVTIQPEPPVSRSPAVSIVSDPSLAPYLMPCDDDSWDMEEGTICDAQQTLGSKSRRPRGDETVRAQETLSSAFQTVPRVTKPSINESNPILSSVVGHFRRLW
jgi:hypothetical protein